MSDGRQRRRAKQARRDVRRMTKRDNKTTGDTTLRDIVRSALGRGHPLHLLSVAGLIIHMAKPDPLAFLKSRQRDTLHLDQLVTNLIGVRNRETTALLAVLAELLVDDPAPQLRCRHELAQRDDHLPLWLTALPQLNVYRAVRRTHVLGEVDELVIGTRLKEGHEMTIAVTIDHNDVSVVADAVAVQDSIDKALARAAEFSTDTSVVEISPADARASIEHALARQAFAPQTETWKFHGAVAQWLVAQLPEGGECRSPAWDWKQTKELCDAFFASPLAAPFREISHGELLAELLDTGTGDPLRWSGARVERALDDPSEYGDRMPVEVALDAPDLLRAFIPYAHAQSGIREGLTARALAVIDELRSRYKREVLRQEQSRWLDDEAV